MEKNGKRRSLADNRAVESTVASKRGKKKEDVVELMQEDEFIEVTPKSIRLRKRELDSSKRASERKREKLLNAS
jgi:predicted membrane GTPase involved in stress response